MKINIRNLATTILTLSILFANAQSNFVSSDSKDIDVVRKAIPSNATDETNFRKRSILMYMCLGAISIRLCTGSGLPMKIN